MTDALARVIRKAGVAVHLKPYNSIRSHLVHPKDKVEKTDKSEVVYHIQCKDCTDTYVGETGRQLKFRLHDHRTKASSHVKQHTERADHSFSDEGVSILHHESDRWKRGVAEAIYIDRDAPSLNREKGRHDLPPIYREILTAKSHDQNNNSGHVTRCH